jgi:hypothetical protein
MIGYELTNIQKDNIQGKSYSNWQVFSCALSINNVWYIILSEQDKSEIIDTEYSWILYLPQSEFIPKNLPI